MRAGEYLSAPTATVPVPTGAATYTPPSSTSFSGKAFATWVDTQKKESLASKWLKIAPGAYNYAIDDIIAIGFTPGGWTLDLRGVTFLISVPTSNPTSNQDIYINQPKTSPSSEVPSGSIKASNGPRQESHPSPPSTASTPPPPSPSRKATTSLCGALWGLKTRAASTFRTRTTIRAQTVTFST